MANESFARGSVETGGELYGLRTHAGRPVIFLATPPGPRAIHETDYFEQDLDFFRNTNSFLKNRYGLLFHGNWHSHHLIGLNKSSPRDVASIMAIMEKNPLPDFLQIILTHQAPQHGGSRVFSGRRRPGHVHIDTVRINCYVYGRHSAGEACQVSVRLLSGVSPFRLALRENGDINDSSLGFPRRLIPRVRLDLQQDHRLDSDAIPEQLVAELNELPESVLETSQLTTDGRRALFTAFLTPTRRLHLLYSLDAPIQPVAVLLEDGDDSAYRDVTSKVLPSLKRARAVHVYTFLSREHADLIETGSEIVSDVSYGERPPQDNEATVFLPSQQVSSDERPASQADLEEENEQ
jgi:hypothetical protein